MTTRRDFMQLALATAPFLAGANASRAFAQQKLTQQNLLEMPNFGNVTLMHLTDLHAQMLPLYYREPTINLGVGEAAGRPPHLTGKDLLAHYKIPANTPQAHALTDIDFTAMAKTYGRVGGMAQIATAVKHIRAARPFALLLDGGDTWQNSWVSLQTKSQDVVEAMNALKVDAMTGHWEFTLGEQRVLEILKANAQMAFLAQNVRENEFNEEVFEPSRIFERNGVKIAVIGQALPYTPIANPSWMIPKWSFGIREAELQKQVNQLKEKADIIVLLSHNGFDVDYKLATRVKGVDVILCAHTHDALPAPLKVGETLLVASGSHGKFLSRLDLDVQNKAIKGFSYRLIPIFSDVITPDKSMETLITHSRKPYEAHLNEVVGESTSLLYRRGNFNGTWDDVICEALLKERDSEISLSPGFRWGTTLLPGKIKREDIYNNTAMTYPAVYRNPMSGARLKEVLEDVADNIFNPDPYLQGGGDMVRVGGLSYAIDVNKPIGQRISNLTLLRDGKPLDAAKEYTVAGWGAVAQNVEGPPVWELVTKYIVAKKSVSVAERVSPLVR